MLSQQSKLLIITLASISIIAAVVHLPVMLLGFDLRLAGIIIASALFLYVLALSTMNLSYQRGWNGFARLPILIVWVLLGFGAASFSLIIGVSFGRLLDEYYKKAKGEKEPSLFKSLEHIANHGTSLLVGHLVYGFLAAGVFTKISEPTRYFAISNFAPYYNLLAVSLAFLAASLSSLVIAYLLKDDRQPEFFKNIPRDFLPELSIWLFALGLPLIFVIFGETAFLLLMGLLAAKNIQQIQVNRTEMQLKQRIREISTLNSLGHAISSKLSLPNVLEAIYQELSAVIDSTSLVVALYDEEQATFDYRLVVRDGKHLVWPKRKLREGVIDYVVRHKESLILARQNKSEVLLRGIDPTLLDDAQYMAVPLVVADKILGVIGVSNSSNSQAFSHSDFELLETVASQASLAIRNATLYERTVRLADNLAIINQSLQDVMFNLDRQDALLTACEIARSVTRSQKAAIFLLQPNRDNRMERIQALGFDNLDFVDSLEYRPDLFHDGARIVRNVADTDYADIRHQAELGKFKASLQIPLRSGNTIVGSLAVYHDEPYLYDATERNLLEMLANQITAALDNADLLQALELYAAEQAQLVHLSRISGISLDLERIIHDVCEMMKQVMNMYRVEIGLHNAERALLRLESPDEDGIGLTIRELSLVNFPEFQRILSPDSMATLRTFYNDVPEEMHSEAMSELFEAYGDATIAVIPMIINKQVIGTILLGDKTHRIFNDNDYRLLEMAAHQVTAQVHNARVHTQTEEALVQRLEQLALIEEIAQQISQAMDLEVIIQNVLEAALQSTQADFAALALAKGEEGDNFEVIWREVVGDKLLPNTLNLQITEGVVGHVARTGEMVLVGDNQSFSDYFSPPTVQRNFKSSLAVPLKKGEKVFGVLNLESKLPNFFTMEQASFIKNLAGHAAISIENANLLEERESRISTLNLLRELSLETLSVIEPQVVAQAVLRTALVVLDARESSLYRYDASQNKLVWIDGARSENGHLSTGKFDIPENLLQEAAQRGTLQLIPDTSKHPAYDKAIDYSHRSLIVIPIARRRRVCEILCIGFAETRQFSHEDLNTIDLLALQIAGHLENAALNEEISLSNDRVRAILNSTRDGIVLLDLEGRVQDVNNAAVKLSGLELDIYLQESLLTIVTKSEYVEAAWLPIVEAYLAAPESIHEQEYTIALEDSLVHLRLLVFNVTDEDGDNIGRLLVMRDITQEKELRAFRDKMQSYVLHDLRGPLSSIITSMYVGMNLAETVTDDSLASLMLPTLQVSLDSANDLLHMVDTLRDLPMMKEMEIEPQFIRLRELAEKAYNSLSSNLLEANITVNYDIPTDAQVYVDSNLIQRVIMNLMHNAFKFTPENGQILIRMEVDTAQDNYVRVLLADTGPGIPEEERDRIFGQFVQIKGRKPRAGGKGMGLGLNFCKLAVEAHGGHIWVEPNSPLSGACFAFTLPCQALQN